ncbi:MAG TPA: hypothetical protein VHZ56_06375 [Devosia sp.]|nr:hypothetical protein [Devosia sp.]
MATAATLEPAAPAVRRSPVTRHLVLVNRRGWQAPDDLYRIAAKVRWLDPTIGTFVVAGDLDDGVTRDAAAALPSLVVSFGPLGRFQPARGRVYQGQQIHKFDQLRRLSAAGVPVPMTAMLGPDTVLDPQRWGEFVVLKPTDLGSSSHGSGIQLIRTARVKYRPPEDYPEGHPGRVAPMLVQQFISMDGHLGGFRVLSFFGEPLYCIKNGTVSRKVDLSAGDDIIEDSPIAMQSLDSADRTRAFVYDADVIETARAAYRAVPEAPLQGCDVMRDHRTGRVYVLELNPGGNTWHFSSDYNAEARAKETPETTLNRYAQFDAFNTAAYILAARVRAEAE